MEFRLTLRAFSISSTLTKTLRRPFGRNQISVQVSGFGFQILGFADT